MGNRLRWVVASAAMVVGLPLMPGMPLWAVDTAPASPEVRDWRYVLTIHDIARADDDQRLTELVTANPDRTKLRLADGRTPVHIAAEVGALKSLRALAKAGADLNVADNAQRTPLAIAISRNFPATAKTLIELGADVNREGMPDLAAGEALRTPLAIAARRDLPDLLKILLDAKADVNKQSSDGATPLLEAAATRHFVAMATLLEHSADANARDAHGVTALIYAAQAGDHDAVQALLSHGANPRLTDQEGRAALSVTRDGELWKMLVAHGADVNVVVGGTTPLQYFIAEGDVGLIEVWLEFKPDPLVPDRKGLTAKELAKKFATNAPDKVTTRKEIARILQEYQNQYVAAHSPATTVPGP